MCKDEMFDLNYVVTEGSCENAYASPLETEATTNNSSNIFKCDVNITLNTIILGLKILESQLKITFPTRWFCKNYSNNEFVADGLLPLDDKS